MGQVIAFSQLPEYLERLKAASPTGTRATILDTNVLITSGYEVREEHERVHKVLDLLNDHGYRLLATVNTKAEFLEFQRRLLLTETLLDLVDEHSKARVPSAARAKIATLKGSLKTSVGADSERDFIFNDVHLKKIKKEFSAGPHSGRTGWLEICANVLDGRLKELAQELEDSGVEYVSQHDAAQVALFHTKIDWPDAMSISERTGASFSDSMILNAFQCSHCPFIVSMDFDVGYAVLADPRLKDAVVPDRLAAEYRHYHFA
jgi:predicted nucleic acid-binding protein